MRTSASFRIGAIISSPIPTITAGPSLFPHSCSRYTVVRPCGQPSWRSTANSITGFPRSVHATGYLGFHLFAGGTTSACLHQAGRQPDPIPFWAVPVIRFGTFCLTAFIGDSRSLTLGIQPSAYPDATSGVTPTPSRALASRVGATLTERFAPGSYPPSTAPWLPAAESRVGLSIRRGPQPTIACTAFAVLFSTRRTRSLYSSGLSAFGRVARSSPGTTCAHGSCRTLGKPLLYH